MIVGGSCSGSPTDTRCRLGRMTLSRDMAAISSCACPASSMMSRATGAAFFSASADSCGDACLGVLEQLVRHAGKSLEGPP
eukprot:2367567-Pyramimonas_sp.AAC.1